VQSAAAPLELAPLRVAPLDAWLPRLAGGPDVATPVSWLAATAPAAMTAPAVTAGVWAFRRRHTLQQQWYMLHITPMHVAATPTPTYNASWASSDMAVPVVVSTYTYPVQKFQKIAQNTIFLCLQAREGCDICTKHDQSTQKLPA
jgi:hypothetical protein